MTDLIAVKHDINSLRQDFKNHQVLTNEQQVKTNDKIDEVGKKVDRLILLLEGDPADPNRGFFNRVREVEKFKQNIENTKMYLMGNVAAVIFIITLLGTIIAFIAKVYEFFKK
jgi:hypothetical protein